MSLTWVMPRSPGQGRSAGSSVWGAEADTQGLGHGPPGGAPSADRFSIFGEESVAHAIEETSPTAGEFIAVPKGCEAALVPGPVRPLPDGPGQALHFLGGLACCLFGPGHAVSRRRVPFLRFPLFLVRLLKVLACLPQPPLGGGHLSSGLVVPVTCPFQQRVGVRSRGAQLTQPSVGGPGRFAGLTESLLLPAALLGDLVLSASPCGRWPVSRSNLLSGCVGRRGRTTGKVHAAG